MVILAVAGFWRDFRVWLCEKLSYFGKVTCDLFRTHFWELISFVCEGVVLCVGYDGGVL
jgi:hypothetical protein